LDFLADLRDDGRPGGFVSADLNPFFEKIATSVEVTVEH
jgi:hypothetical protein